MSQWSWMAAAVLCLSFMGGCGGKAEVDARPERFPTKGSVTYNGKPAPGAKITFWQLPLSLEDKTAWQILRPRATAASDGSFQPSCYEPNDGAMKGEYAVTVTWTGGEGPPGPDLLQGRFADPKNPPLKVTIAAGQNTLPPLDLKGSEVASPKGGDAQ